MGKLFYCNNFISNASSPLPQPHAEVSFASFAEFSKVVNIKKYKALLFDLDGTLIDNHKIYTEAWNYVVAPENVTVEQSFLDELAGKSNVAMIKAIKDRYNLKLSVAEMMQRNDDYLDRHLIEQAQLMPLAKLIPEIPAHLKLGIGTGSNYVNSLKLLDKFALTPYFSRIVSADQVEREKPSPLTWLMLAEFFKVNPKECLVFEDGENGMIGALQAGMDVIDVNKHTYLI